MGEAKRRKEAGTFRVNAKNVIRTLIIPKHIIEMGFAGIRSTIDNVERLFEEGSRNQVLMVDGYNDDPRSLWDISEVVNHLMEVTRHSPIAFVVSPSSVMMLLGMKQERCSEMWFENSKDATIDFIGSQIDWLNEHFPMNDEDDEILSSKNIDLSKITPFGLVNYNLSNLLFEKIKYAHKIDMRAELAAFKADERWRKQHPDVE